MKNRSFTAYFFLPSRSTFNQHLRPARPRLTLRRVWDFKCKKLVRELKSLNRLIGRGVNLLAELVVAIRAQKPPRRRFFGGEVTFDMPGSISTTFELNPFLEDFMTNATFTLPADTADGDYVLAPISELVDSEGSVITNFTEGFESSDPSVISLTPNDPSDIHQGRYHIGSPGVATVKRTVTTTVGRNLQQTILGVFTFIITAGAPVQVTEAPVDFVGLVPDPAE